MKNLLFRVLFAICIVVCFSGCSFENEQDNSTGSFDPGKKINFDLDQYKDHGKLSDGIVWVIKETSSWDTAPTESYAYLDINGNVVYGWKSVGSYIRDNGKTDRAIVTQDFKNGYALIYDQRYVDWLGGYAEATIIDKTGKIIAEFYISAYEPSTGNPDVIIRYEDFNSQGYAFL